jgi:putative protease
MLIEYIDELIGSGVCSLKIEGRMKTAFYVAGVVNAYRMALDAYAKSPVKRGFRPARVVVEELYKVGHRPFTIGFAFDAHNPDTLAPEAGGTVQQYDFAAVVLDYDEARELAIIEQRNRFFVGDTLEILSPGDIGRSFTVESIINEEGQLQDSAPHPQQRLKLKCTERLLKGDILRKRSS